MSFVVVAFAGNIVNNKLAFFKKRDDIVVNKKAESPKARYALTLMLLWGIVGCLWSVLYIILAAVSNSKIISVHATTSCTAKHNWV